MNIDKIRDKDDLIHKVLEKSFPGLIKDSKKFQHKTTSTALISLALKINFLKNGIFDLCETDNVYPAKILFRALIEHSLKHQYLLMRSSIEKSDDVGKDYYKFCDMNEDLLRLNSINNFIKKLNLKKQEIDTWEELCKINKDFNKITKKGLKYKADQFKYLNIITYLSNEVKDNLVRDFLAKVILNYCELSSFVHGGPCGEKSMHKGLNVAQKELKKIAEMAFSFNKNINLTTYLLAFQIYKKYGLYYKQIKNVKI